MDDRGAVQGALSRAGQAVFASCMCLAQLYLTNGVRRVRSKKVSAFAVGRGFTLHRQTGLDGATARQTCTLVQIRRSSAEAAPAGP